jgi:hypothetical protein
MTGVGVGAGRAARGRCTSWAPPTYPRCWQHSPGGWQGTSSPTWCSSSSMPRGWQGRCPAVAAVLELGGGSVLPPGEVVNQLHPSWGQQQQGLSCPLPLAADAQIRSTCGPGSNVLERYVYHYLVNNNVLQGLPNK